MIDIKTDHIKQINQLLYEFLWSGKKYNVKRDICVLPRYMGGLGMVDIATVVKVRKVKWVIKVLKGQTNDVWKILPLSYFKCLDKDFDIPLFALRVTNATDLVNGKKIPLFYKECILALQELYRKAEDIPGDEDQIIWCHHKFHLRGKPVVLKHWSKNGIKFFSDLFSNGR